MGQTNVRPPVASWQMTKLMVCPALALDKVELVTFPVSVSFCVLPKETSKVGVEENVTGFTAPR